MSGAKRHPPRASASANSSSPSAVRVGHHFSKDRREKRRVRAEEDAERVAILKRIEKETPPSGYHPLVSDLHTKSSTSSSASSSSSVLYGAARKFVELPLSQRTLNGLNTAKYKVLTDIQRASLPHSLAGRDVLGAARTGSGKTLAFLLPLLERLWRVHWNPREDGIGAIVLTPTRELAMQIFDVLRIIGAQHDFSAALIIGGSHYSDEREKICKMNILVATPGRLLQHLEQTYQFECPNLQILCIDEADRILDLGFEETLNNIVASLPTEDTQGNRRQTLLFSATQTKNVKDLARLSLKNPEYISVHETADSACPRGLQQHYVEVAAEKKFDLLYSFIKTHLKTKILIFASTAKQVRFLFEVFRRIRPGIPLLHLHGGMNQKRRMAIYYEFCNKDAAVLFSTDISARGLDFPNIDWVLQMDCPESVATYIHRVGRTARYRAKGKALLLLTPGERHFLALLKEKKLSVSRVRPKEDEVHTTLTQFQGFCAQNADIKYLAQTALISYLRSIYLQSDKSVFDIKNYDVQAISQALGLAITPTIKFAKTSAKTQIKEKNLPYQLRKMMNESSEEANEQDDDRVDDKKNAGEKLGAVERLIRRRNNTVFSESRRSIAGDFVAQTAATIEDENDKQEESEHDIDGLRVKRRDADIDVDALIEEANQRMRELKEHNRVNHTENAACDEDEEEEADNMELEEEEAAMGRDGEELDLEEEFTTRKRMTDFDMAAKASALAARQSAFQQAVAVNDENDSVIRAALSSGADFVENAVQRLKGVDVEDKERDKSRVKEKHRNRNRKEKLMRKMQMGQMEDVYTLHGQSDDAENGEENDAKHDDDDTAPQNESDDERHQSHAEEPAHADNSMHIQDDSAGATDNSKQDEDDAEDDDGGDGDGARSSGGVAWNRGAIGTEQESFRLKGFRGTTDGPKTKKQRR